MQARVIDHCSDVTVLRLQGELDAETAAELQATLASLLDRPVPRIVVDLSDLKFCDSMGLSAFITSKNVISERGGWLSFAGANPFLDSLMQTVGLSRYFAMFPDVEEAIAAARPEPGPHVRQERPARPAPAGGDSPTGAGRASRRGC